MSEFKLPAVPERGALVERVLACRDESIAEADLMFEQGMYTQYLMQFGPDCAPLPAAVGERLAQARKQLQQG